MIRVRFGSLIINTTLVIKCNKNYLRCIFGGGSFSRNSCDFWGVSRLCDPGYVASVSPSSWSLPLAKARKRWTMGSRGAWRIGLQVIHRWTCGACGKKCYQPHCRTRALGEEKGRGRMSIWSDHIGSYRIIPASSQCGKICLNDIAYGIISLMSLDQGEIMLHHSSS